MAADAAGPDSPHLDEREQSLAERHQAPHALVIHEVVREEGEKELDRPPSALFWSGLAAGLSMGFSLVCLALLQNYLPDAPWRHILASPGYSVGFVIVILGRQQLFTETTLTAMLPVLLKRDRETVFRLLRMWAIVLTANIIGTFAFALFLTERSLFPDQIRESMVTIGHHVVADTAWANGLKAVLAGWLIALMVWILPSARSARLFVVLLLTFVVALGHFPHIIAGSVEATFAVFMGDASWADYFGHFFAPTLIGNTIGGVALTALLNHAPVVTEMRQTEEEERRQPSKRKRGHA